MASWERNDAGLLCLEARVRGLTQAAGMSEVYLFPSWHWDR
jgi:hypothetical protein